MFLFGSAAAASGGIYNSPLFTLLVIGLTVFIFLKFCGWAKKQMLSAGAKKGIFILTAVGLVAFNVMYSMGNKAFENSGDLNMATIAVVSALLWVFVFSYALMSETK
ncbi:MAG: hypothetical protein ACOX0F_07370 [Syntrophomonadaceae bacterium]